MAPTHAMSPLSAAAWAVLSLHPVALSAQPSSQAAVEPAEAAEAAEAAESPPSQAAVEPAEAVESPPSQTPTPAAAPAAPVDPSGNAAICVPGCATGYECRGGQCVSGCHPPCGWGETCQQGSCSRSGSAGARWAWGDSRDSRDSRGLSAGNASAVVLGGGGEEPAVSPDPSVHAHDGLLLRWTLALGGGSATYEAVDGERELAGAGAHLSFDIGAAVAANFVLHARLSTFNLGAETKPAEDGEVGTASLSGGFIAAAVSYYFMPLNLYVAGALGALGGRLKNVDEDGSQDPDMRLQGGWIVQIEATKEWWIGGDWGMGVGVQLGTGAARVVEDDEVDGGLERALRARSEGPYESDLAYWNLSLLGSVTYQ